MAALGDAGRLIPEVTTTQIFNWVPGFGATGTNPYENFRLLDSVVRPRMGLAVNAGLGGERATTVFSHVRGDALTVGEMEKLAREWKSIALWITERDHWEREVAGFKECLASRQAEGAGSDENGL